MATLTIRNLPETLVQRLKAAAAEKSHSMEQEVREILAERFLSRESVLRRMRQRWERGFAPTPEEVERWIEEGRA